MAKERSLIHEWFPTDVQMIGGFCAALTNDERNQFHEFISARPEWAEMCEAETQMHTLALCATGADPSSEVCARYRAAREIYQQKINAFYPISKQWYADLRAKNAAQTEKE